MNQVFSSYVKSINNLCVTLNLDGINTICSSLLESYREGKKYSLQATAEVPVLQITLSVISVRMR